MLSGVRAQIALKIYGDDYDTLRGLAADLEARLKAIPGIVDLQTEKQVRIPQLQVRVDYAKAALYGLNPSQVTEALEALSNGMVVSQIIDQSKRFDVVVRLSDADRSTRALGEMMIESPAGRIPLGTIADVIETDGPNQIQRENGRRRIAVLANTDGTDMARIIAAIRAAVAETQFPQGYFANIEGQFQAQEEASRMIGLLSAVSLLLIFVVLYSRYRSGVLALIIMGNVPLALIGSVAALWIAGQPFSVASAIGFITLAGIATRNGILKISHYINLSLFEGETFGRQLVVRGTLERLTPVLMTALAAGIALVPLLVGADEPGKEILHPVAVTIFGGLISATLLDAFLTPTLFLSVRPQRAGAAAGGGRRRNGRARRLLVLHGLEHAGQHLDELVDLALLDDQRGRERDGVTRGAHKDAAVEGFDEACVRAPSGLARDGIELDGADQARCCGYR